ncbi:hypothetical protein LINPERHAP2_LOCUS3288, partial [Linum perenne]
WREAITLGFVSEWTYQRSSYQSISCNTRFDAWNMRDCMWYASNVVSMNILMSYARKIWHLPIRMGNKFTQTLFS